mmetsp:Transcript_90905/g.266167  ORF Transcript_90905/g.266167 Transcript_90905/m.266167 type:complete len:233 (+) Transcript_90905:554-1252(+)
MGSSWCMRLRGVWPGSGCGGKALQTAELSSSTSPLASGGTLWLRTTRRRTRSSSAPTRVTPPTGTASSGALSGCSARSSPACPWPGGECRCWSSGWRSPRRRRGPLLLPGQRGRPARRHCRSSARSAWRRCSATGPALPSCRRSCLWSAPGTSAHPPASPPRSRASPPTSPPRSWLPALPRPCGPSPASPRAEVAHLSSMQNSLMYPAASEAFRFTNNYCAFGSCSSCDRWV